MSHFLSNSTFGMLLPTNFKPTLENDYSLFSPLAQLICPFAAEEPQNAISCCSNQNERYTGADMAQGGRRSDVAGSLSLFKALS